MSTVWAAAIGPPTNKLALLALADWCNNEGGSLHPSQQSIADKVGVSRSQAQRIVRGFVEQGLLSVVANQFGGAPGSTPHYRLHLDVIAKLPRTGRTDAAPTDSVDAIPTGSADATPTDSTHATGSAGATGSMDALEGSHGSRGRVAPMRQTGSTGATQTTMNHHRTTKEPSEGARGTRLPSGWSLPVEWRDWATSARPDLDPSAVADTFADYWVAQPGQKGVRADWAATWRNWVRKERNAAVQASSQQRRRADSLMAGNIAAAHRYLETQ